MYNPRMSTQIDTLDGRVAAVRYYGGGERGVIFEFLLEPAELEGMTLFTCGPRSIARTQVLQLIHEFENTTVLWPSPNC